MQPGLKMRPRHEVHEPLQRSRGFCIASLSLGPRDEFEMLLWFVPNFIILHSCSERVLIDHLLRLFIRCPSQP